MALFASRAGQGTHGSVRGAAKDDPALSGVRQLNERPRRSVRPRKDSNLRARFKKPMLYPLS